MLLFITFSWHCQYQIDLLSVFAILVAIFN